MIATLLACLLSPTPGDPPPVKLVRAWEAFGHAQGGEFGTAAAFLGDIDFDGLQDVLVSAPQAARRDGQPGEGLVHLLSGADGRELWCVHGEAAGERLGTTLAVLDDVNVDGRPDFAAMSDGATTEATTGGWTTGIVVRSGRDGSILCRLVAPAQGQALGHGLVAIGDVDGDGHRDLLVGMRQRLYEGANVPNWRPDPGYVLVYSGATGRFLKRIDGDTADFGRSAFGLEDPRHLGPGEFGIGDDWSMLRLCDDRTAETRFELREPAGSGGRSLGPEAASLGDLDGDGSSDFAINEIRLGDFVRPSGAPRLVFLSGRDGHGLGDWSGPTMMEQRRVRLASLPDLDGDGLRELVVSDPEDFAYRGLVDVVAPRSGKMLAALPAAQPSREFGSSLAAIDDLGEGSGPALLVGSVGDERGALRGGAAALYTLKPLPRPHR